jgi:hypothetical protein
MTLIFSKDLKKCRVGAQADADGNADTERSSSKEYSLPLGATPLPEGRRVPPFLIKVLLQKHKCQLCKSIVKTFRFNSAHYCEKCIRQEISSTGDKEGKGIDEKTVSEFKKRMDEVDQFLSELSELKFEQVSIRTMPPSLRLKIGVTKMRIGMKAAKSFRVPQPVIDELSDVLRIEKVDGVLMCCQCRVRNVDLKRYCLIRKGPFEKVEACPGTERAGTRYGSSKQSVFPRSCRILYIFGICELV